MKHFLLLLFFSYSFVVAKSEAISPLQSSEFCPNTEYTFTVSISKPYSSMIGEGGCVVIQLLHDKSPPFCNLSKIFFYIKQIKHETVISIISN